MEAKKAEKDLEDGEAYKTFVLSVLKWVFVGVIVIIFVFGGLSLFLTKVAQSNILPDNIDLAPFTNIDRVVTPNFKVDMNIVRVGNPNKATYSQKAIFDTTAFLKSFQNGWLCKIKAPSNPKDAGLFGNAQLYFSAVYGGLVSKDFGAINTVGMALASMPEFLIMMLGGFLGILFFMGLYGYNVCLAIFYHLVSIPQLFRQQAAYQQGQWENDADISLFRLSKIVAFFLVWLPVGIASTIISPIIFTIYSLIAPFFATYSLANLNNTNNAQGNNAKRKPRKNVLDFLLSTFANKKLFFIVLTSIIMIYQGSKHLGKYAWLAVAVALSFTYLMGFFSTRTDAPEMEANGTNKRGFTQKLARRDAKKAPLKPFDANKVIDLCNPTLLNADEDEYGINGYTGEQEEEQEEQQEEENEFDDENKDNTRQEQEYNDFNYQQDNDEDNNNTITTSENNTTTQQPAISSLMPSSSSPPSSYLLTNPVNNDANTIPNENNTVPKENNQEPNENNEQERSDNHGQEGNKDRQSDENNAANDVKPAVNETNQSHDNNNEIKSKNIEQQGQQGQDKWYGQQNTTNQQGQQNTTNQGQEQHKWNGQQEQGEDKQNAIQPIAELPTNT